MINNKTFPVTFQAASIKFSGFLVGYSVWGKYDNVAVIFKT